MNGETKDNSEIPNKTSEIERAQFLWNEYTYRHEHCWKLIFQTTTAVVVLSVIPYTRVDIARVLGNWIVSLPALGVALSIFAILRLNRELNNLNRIKNKYKYLQKSLFPREELGTSNTTIGNSEESCIWGKIKKKCKSILKGKSKFRRDVRLYMISLVLLGIVNIFAISCIWIPSLR